MNQANERPPGGSITGHRGILTLPRDEEQFMVMWTCVIAAESVEEIGSVYVCNSVNVCHLYARRGQ